MDVNVDLTDLSDKSSGSTTCPNIKGETAMNTVVNSNREFINNLKKLENLEKSSCPSISITELCQKVSSTFCDLHFNIC